jgi:hypothetical protein
VPEPNEAYEHYAHVLDAQVTPSGQNPLGHVCWGVLTISYSTIVSGKLVTNEYDGGIRHEVEILSPDGLLELFEVETESTKYMGHIVYVLPLVHGMGDESSWLNQDYIHGLLLPTNNNKGEYYRIGFFRFFRNSGTRGRFVNVLGTLGVATAESACARVLSDPKYSGERYAITII